MYPFLGALVPGVLFTIVEYLGGEFMVHVMGRRAWDYSQNVFNINGHIDLWHTSIWILIGFIFITYIHPYISNILFPHYYSIGQKHITKNHF